MTVRLCRGSLSPDASQQVWGGGDRGHLATLREVLVFRRVILIPRYKISTLCTGLRISVSPVET